MLALALTLLAMPQEAVPETQQKPSPEEIQSWWEGLSEQEQSQYRERQQLLRDLQPTMREELERRHELLRDERGRIVENFSEEERKRFEDFGRDERRRFLDERARTNFRRRGERLEQEFPGVGPPRSQEDWAARHHRVAKIFEQRRAPQVRESIAQAVAAGWLGPTAAKWLETAPIYEAMTVLGEVHKWQFLQQAKADGLWEEMGFDAQQRREITALPAFDFFHAVRGFRERGGPGKFGPPAERRAERRGEGRGPGSERGPRPGRRGGEQGLGESGGPRQQRGGPGDLRQGNQPPGGETGRPEGPPPRFDSPPKEDPEQDDEQLGHPH